MGKKDSQLWYAGCLRSDPYHSLQSYDRIALEGLQSAGTRVIDLQAFLPKLRIFRTLNRNVLYPLLVAFVTRLDRRALLLISNQCYAHLIPFSHGKSVVVVHGLHEHYSPEDLTEGQFARWERRCAYLTDATRLVAVSERVKKDLIDLFFVAAKKISVNYEGIDASFLQAVEEMPASGYQRKESWENSGEFLVLSVGTNLRVKNMETLLRAIAWLREKGVPVRLIKAGDRLLETHASLVTQCGLTNAVTDLGFLNSQKLNRLYRKVDVLSFPSLYEGFGLPVLEAQSCGLPCVLSNAGALPEVGGDSALYHGPTDVDQLARQLRRVYQEEGLRDSMEEKGRIHAASFSWKKHVRRLNDLLRESV